MQPLDRCVEACHAAGAHLFVDATQGVGKLPLTSALRMADAYAIAGSKLSGPAGSGALVLRGAEVAPQVVGGGQESGRRGGSPGLAAAVGLGVACAALEGRLSAMERVGRLRDRLEAQLEGLGARVNGAEGPRVASVVNASLADWRGDLLVAALDLEGLACSSGAACSSGVSGGSAVLAALYPDEPWRASHALRLSLGPGTTEPEVARASAILTKVIARSSAG
ncbi:MAG: aminotransferase class V-fold PLP-dependent enzyme [Deltaproteobacteria bacterium]|nr:aminotransferase class V-fold PLP-dependent enzyme [Deltaproteobacteria bacterium]